MGHHSWGLQLLPTATIIHHCVAAVAGNAELEGPAAVIVSARVSATTVMVSYIV